MTLASDVFGTNASQSINSRDIARSNSTQFSSNNITKSLASRSSSIFDSLKSAFSFMGNTIESLFNRERQSSQEHLQATTLQKVVIQTGESSRLLSTLFDSHNVGLNLLVLIDKKLEELLKRDQCDGKKTTLESLADYRNAAVLAAGAKGVYEAGKWGIGAIAAGAGFAIGMLPDKAQAAIRSMFPGSRQPQTREYGNVEGVWPKNIDQETKEAVNEVARENDLDPNAIAAVIKLESGWQHGSVNQYGYAGLAQIGRNEFQTAGGKLGGLTYEEYKKASPAAQIKAYGDYLKTFRFKEKTKDMNLSELDAPTQAAILQGFQFAPNATSWQRAYIGGNIDVQTTNTQQAKSLGSTSIRDMREYYRRQLSPPSGTAIPTTPTAPQTGAAINRISSERMRDFVVGSNEPVNTVVYNTPTTPNFPDSINGENTDPDSQYPVSPPRATLARMYGTDLAAILGVTSAA